MPDPRRGTLCHPPIYGGKSFKCAATETVFNDLPFAPGPKVYDKSK